MNGRDVGSPPFFFSFLLESDFIIYYWIESLRGLRRVIMEEALFSIRTVTLHWASLFKAKAMLTSLKRYPPLIFR